MLTSLQFIPKLEQNNVIQQLPNKQNLEQYHGTEIVTLCRVHISALGYGYNNAMYEILRQCTRN